MSIPMPQYSAPGVFNARDPWYNDTVHGFGWTGMIAHTDTSDVWAVNRAVLQAIINLAQTTDCSGNPFGALIIIPGHAEVPSQDGSGDDSHGAEYFIEMPGDGMTPSITIDCNWPIRIVGTGSTKLTARFPDDDHESPFHFFDINTGPGGEGGSDNVGGIVFEDLQFGFPEITYGSKAAAIHTNSAENARINRCVFNDCPIGVWFEDGLYCDVAYCTFQWQDNAGTGIKMGNGDTEGDDAAVNYIHVSDCVMTGQNAPTPCIGILIEGSEHVCVARTHIYGCYHGIQIVPGTASMAKNALRHTFTDTTVYINPDDEGTIGYAVLIQPQSSNVNVAQIVFTSCFFELSENATVEFGGPGILVDASNATIDTVRFVSCYSTRWPGPGLTITGSGSNLPQNIEVLGGMYAGNNYPGLASQESYGIHVGPSAGVRIIGVDCVGTYTYVTNDSMGSVHQQDVGIYVDGGATDTIIDACDVTGNASNGIVVDGSGAAVTGIFIRNCNASGYTGGYNVAVSVLGSVSNIQNLQITSCSGYNDQGATLTATGFAGTTNISSAICKYWGPIEFYAVVHSAMSITAMTIDGTNTHLPSGSIYLAPGETGSVSWTPTANTIYLTIRGK